MAKASKQDPSARNGPHDPAFGYSFPSVRGVQAGREYYVSMCPLRVIPKLFVFNEEKLTPEIRAQRVLNKSRIPLMARYMVENPSDYVFSAITASVDGEIRFEPLGTGRDGNRIGTLHVPMKARFIINDGQHRRAAIERALQENSDLGDESIAVVLFQDIGLERCQQMFADLNRYAIRPAKSLGVLYDYRDERARLARMVAFCSTAFCELVDMERSTLSLRSRKLFTLSSIYTATVALLDGTNNGTPEKDTKAAISFWDEVGEQFPEWGSVRKGETTASKVRRNFIHSYGIVLHAIGNAGNAMLRTPRLKWKPRLKRLNEIDWSRSNKLWEGRALVGGRLSKAGSQVRLTTNVIKERLGLRLTPEETHVEDAFLQASHA